MTRRIERIVVLLGACLAMLLPSGAIATDLTYFQTIYNTDFTSAGYGGMRNIGSGDITVNGVSGNVTKAYLYWAGPNDSTDDNNNANVTFNGSNVTGTFLGATSDNCWFYTNSLAYRADVTSLVSGDGTYSLSNFIHTDAFGATSEINGASLIVFYDDGNVANNRDVVMFDGNDSNASNPYDANGWNLSLSGIDYSSGTAEAQFHVSDGQAYADSALVANGTDLAPAGAVFQGDSVPGGPGGPANSGGLDKGYLWDIKNFDVTSLLNPGDNTLDISNGQAQDCIACVMVAIDLPAGAAPPPPVPEPGSLLLLGSGVAALGSFRRWSSRGLLGESRRPS